MRRKGLPAAAVVIVVVGLAIAGATARPAPSADLSAAVPTALSPALQTLITTGVLPGDVRGEPGVWNFAGPAAQCPGPGWVCTVPGIFPIVQNGLVNVAVADEACPETTQTGTYNKLECIDEVKSGEFAHQACNASQSGGGHNELLCKLTYDVTTSANTQCVVQEANFDQSGITNKFKGQLRIVQQMNSNGGQEQDARQLITGEQNADEKNESEIEQVQIQKMSGAGNPQLQNTGCTSSEAPMPSLSDCNEQGEGPSTPYTCVMLEQDVEEGGDNISKLKQEVKEDATTSVIGAEEQQGTFEGGNDASVHQDVFSGDSEFASLSSGSSGEGKSFGVSDQYTYQTLPTRPDLEQEQYEDPWCCFGSQEGGGPDSEEIINQWVEQFANENAEQFAHATGETESPGKCTINHDLENNGGSADRTASEEGGGCGFLRMDTTCSNNTEAPDGCFDTTPSDFTLFRAP